MKFLLTSVAILTASTSTLADNLRHSYCFCETKVGEGLWGWVQRMTYHSDRLNMDYVHDFKCEPKPGFGNADRGECGKDDKISGTEEPFCHVFEDGVEVCMRDWQYAFDGVWMQRLPGWYKGGAKYVEGSSKNKKRITLTDCTGQCKDAFPTIKNIQGDCSYNNHDEVVTPVLVKDQCKVYDYKALSIL